MALIGRLVRADQARSSRRFCIELPRASLRMEKHLVALYLSLSFSLPFFPLSLGMPAKGPFYFRQTNDLSVIIRCMQDHSFFLSLISDIRFGAIMFSPSLAKFGMLLSQIRLARMMVFAPCHIRERYEAEAVP